MSWEQLSMFEQPRYVIDKPIRLIELFGGVGCQLTGIKRTGADVESWKYVEFDKYPVASFNAIHGTDYTPMDIRDVKGGDLGIEDTDKYCYIMTYSFPCQLS